MPGADEGRLAYICRAAEATHALVLVCGSWIRNLGEVHIWAHVPEVVAHFRCTAYVHPLLLVIDVQMDCAINSAILQKSCSFASLLVPKDCCSSTYSS